MNIKSVGKHLTTPTAFSWYGVIGVVATGVLTFFSTKKWLEQKKEPEEEQSFKDKAKEIGKTALIFTPPVAAAVGASYCILHGNNKAMIAVGNLNAANNFLNDKFDKTKAAAAGMALSEARNRLNSQEGLPEGKYRFSNDPAEVEDYGKVCRFHDAYTDTWFDSTIFDVMSAEEALHKEFTLSGHVLLSDFQAMLGIEEIDDWMNYCGWYDSLDFRKVYYWVEFLHHRVIDENGQVYYEIEYVIPPTFEEEFEWYMPDIEE